MKHIAKILWSHTKKTQEGFTLIELLVVTSLLVFLLISISALFMTFLLSGTKLNTRNLVKAEGRHALNQMEFMLRNALELTTNTGGQVCQPGMDRISLLSSDGFETEFRAQGGKIASNSANLTSETVQLVNGPTFDCETGATGEGYVRISFELSKTVPDAVVTERFSTIVSLRN